PDLPCLHAPAVALCDGAHEAAPGVGGVVPRLVEPPGGGGLVVGLPLVPARRADEDGLELGAGRLVRVGDEVGARPEGNALTALDAAPAELPAIPAHAGVARQVQPVQVGVHVADTEAVVAVGDGRQGLDAGGDDLLPWAVGRPLTRVSKRSVPTRTRALG